MDFTYALMTRVTFAFMELIESGFVDTMLYAVGRYVLFYHYEAGSCFWHWLFDNGGASFFNFQYAIHVSSPESYWGHSGCANLSKAAALVPALMPPSSMMACPLMKALSGLARK